MASNKDGTRLKEIYHGYIACLNAQDWAALGRFVQEDAHYNEKRIGLAGYREMLESDFAAIPDLRFDIRLLVCDPPYVSSRLWFDCTPRGDLFGFPVNGKRVSFAENVIYAFRDDRIARVWSVIDKIALRAQIG